jgi:hypothetical protein
VYVDTTTHYSWNIDFFWIFIMNCDYYFNKIHLSVPFSSGIFRLKYLFHLSNLDNNSIPQRIFSLI